MKKTLEYLFEGNTLSRLQAKESLLAVGKGLHTEVEFASFLTVFKMRHITSEELGGFRDAMDELSLKTDLSAYSEIILPSPLSRWSVWLLAVVQGFLFSNPAVHTIFYPSSSILRYLKDAGAPLPGLAGSVIVTLFMITICQTLGSAINYLQEDKGSAFKAIDIGAVTAVGFAIAADVGIVGLVVGTKLLNKYKDQKNSAASERTSANDLTGEQYKGMIPQATTTAHQKKDR